MTGERDPKLGAAVRELFVPEHGPEFWEMLEHHLATDGQVCQPSKARHHRQRPVLMVLGAAAVVVALLAVMLSRSGQEDSSGRVATTPEPAGEGEVAMVSGTAVIVSHPVAMPYCPSCGEGAPTERRFTFSRASDGSFVEAGDTGETTAFDVEAGRMVNLVPGPPGATPGVEVRTGLAPDGPDPSARPLMTTGHFDDIAAYVMAKVRAGDQDVAEVKVAGRPVWRHRAKLAPNELSEASPDEVEVTVDRRTGIVLAATEFRQGNTLRELRVEGLRTSPTIDRSAFAVAVPAGVPTNDEDLGYRRSSLNRVADEVGYGLMAPEPPTGYELAGVWVRPGTGGPTGAEASNPPSTDVVMLVYRDGFRHVTVTTRRQVGTRPWSDPFLGEGQVVNSEVFSAIAAGDSPSSTGEVVFDPATVPHAWATTGRGNGEGMVITVAGPLPKPELMATLSSVRVT